MLDVLAGIFMGTLTGMGIGGAGLLVFYLTEVTGLSQLQAQGCNLLFYVFASAASLYVHNRRRRLDYRLIGVAALLAALGSRLGVGLAAVLPEESVRHLYGWMLVAAGVLSGVRAMRGR